MIEKIDLNPTKRLIDYAISSISEGDTRDYLLDASKPKPILKVNETTIRNDCLELRKQGAEANPNDLVFQSLKCINGFYNTRHSVEKHLPSFAEIFHDEVNKAGWWQSEPPKIYDCTESEIASVC